MKRYVPPSQRPLPQLDAGKGTASGRKWSITTWECEVMVGPEEDDT